MIMEQIQLELADNYFICPDCNCLVSEKDLIDVDGETTFYCNKCILEHAFKCQDCQNWTNIENLNFDYENDRIKYCPDCIQEHFSRCDECGEYVDNDIIIFVDSNDSYVCGECLERYFVCCDSCHEYYRSESRHIWAQDNRLTICQNCSSDYFVCESCNEICHLDDYESEGLCRYCYDNDDNSGYIHDYSYKPDPIFYGNETITDIYKGIELEIDNVNNLSGLVEKLSRFKEIYLKRDGSLSESGVEIVSHPMTLKYIKESFKLDEILSLCREHDAVSHEAGNCGLHIHLNRDFFKNYELSATKILYLFEKFWPEIEKFSRRKDFGYCHKNQFNVDQDIKPREIRKVREKARQNGRYQAVNLCPLNTIEIRVFRGSLNKTTILASIQFVTILSRICNLMSIKKLQDLSWADFKEICQKNRYTEFMEYCQTRGI